MRKLLFSLFTLMVAVSLTMSAANPTSLKVSAKSSIGMSKTALKAAPKSQTPRTLAHMPKLKKAASPSAAVFAQKTASVRLATPTKRKGKFQASSDASWPLVMGNLYYPGDGELDYGLYNLPTSASGSLEFVSPCEGTFGGVLVDGVYYSSYYLSFWGMALVYVYGTDIETGELVLQYQPSGSSAGLEYVAMSQSLNPVDGKVYSYGLTPDGYSYMFSTTEYGDNSVEVTPVCYTDQSVGAIAFDPKGTLYAIVYDVDENSEQTVSNTRLCTVDLTTGEMTEVGPTGMDSEYSCDATIDPKSGRMMWTCYPADDSANLCEVDLTTGAATVVYQFPNGEGVIGLVSPVPAAEDGAPAQVEDFAVDFADGSLEGTVSFTAPTTTYTGDPLTGALTYHVLINGTEVATGSTTAGAAVSAAVTAPESAESKVEAYVSNAVGDGPKAKTTLYIGQDLPMPIEGAEATATEDGILISWEPITESLNGGYIDLSKITYTVSRVLPDEAVLAEKISGTSYLDEIAEPEELTKYQYSIVANYDGLQCEPALTNLLSLGSLVPPYEEHFDNADAFNTFTVINANGDDKTWSYSVNTARIGYGSYDHDDWLITPGIKLQKGLMYEVSFRAGAYSSSYPERIEVKYGKSATPAGLTSVLLESTDIYDVFGTNDVPYNAVIVPESDGIYYIGFHAISDADEYYLIVDDITVAAGVSATSPAEITDLQAVADPNGALTATVSLTAPSTDVNGDAIDALTKVEVLRDGELVKTFEAPTPGEALSFTDALDKGGNHTYSAIAYNENGGSRKASTTVFVGFNIPAQPASATVVETATPGEVMVSWEAVTTDADGKTLPQGSVFYHICEYGTYGWEIKYSDIHDTKYTFQAVEEGEQDFVQYAILAESEIGQAEYLVGTDMIAVGTPYTDLNESFADSSLSYIWAQNTAGGASLGLYGDTDVDGLASQDGDNGYLIINANSLYASASFISGKIALPADRDSYLTFYTYSLGADDENIVDVEVISGGVTTNVFSKTYAEINPEEGWTKVKVSLADYAGKNIQFTISATVMAYTINAFDNIALIQPFEHDLVAKALTAPATVNPGDDYEVQVTLANEGLNPATGHAVQLYADGELVATQACEDLDVDGTATVAFPLSMHALAEEPIEYHAVVDYANDLALDNNESEAVSVAPLLNNLPHVTDLKANNEDGRNVLTWSEPVIPESTSESVEESFEDGAFGDKTYGDWTFVDRDGGAQGGIQNTNIPGITPGQTTGSFFIFHSEDGGNTTANTGTNTLCAMFNYDDSQVDDWAISPTLSGNAQTITFYAKSLNTRYPETIEMYYSVGSTDPDDFIMVDDPVTLTAGDWEQFSFFVPEGATNFAIRNCAAGAFMLMLDDFTFEVGSTFNGLELAGYEIYRNGELLEELHVGGGIYYDNATPEGISTYRVKAVYNRGTSKPSNEASAELSGIADATTAGIAIYAEAQAIVVEGAEGQAITVSAVDGKVIFQGQGEATSRIPAAQGVYIVKAGNAVAKVIVR